MRREIYDQLRSCLDSREVVVLVTAVSGPRPGKQLLVWPRGETLGDLGSPRLNQRAALYAEQIIPSGQSGRKTFSWDGEAVDAFFEVYSPPPELVVIGAVHIAGPLVRFARELGFRTFVVDPRQVFATSERFGEVDELFQKWPAEALPEIGLHAATYLVVLSHALKIALPALELALRSPARYIGALGSKKTQAKRATALREMGFDDAEIARIRSPIGLDLGGRRPEEIALSVVAEMVAARYGHAAGASSKE